MEEVQLYRYAEKLLKTEKKKLYFSIFPSSYIWIEMTYAKVESEILCLEAWKYYQSLTSWKQKLSLKPLLGDEYKVT